MRIALLLFLLIFSSCNVSRQRSAAYEHRQQIDLNETIDAYEEVSQKSTSLDERIITRTSRDAFTEIIPRGAFRISPDGTFEGEAEAVRTFVRDTTTRHEDRRADEREDDHRRYRHEDRMISTESETILEEEESTRRRPHWVFGLFCLAVAALAFLFIRGFLKRFILI